jgi:two-component system response regulator GlrR
MAALLELLSKITPSLSSVLIQGESGTGKELIAQMIHYQGPLANQPLVSLHCGALKESLLESQLFGHVKGAFTGAEVDHVGLLVQAHGGTIFLDEIGELSLDVQAKFLRVLQEGEVRPLGSSKVRKVNFRVLAATHRNLEAMVKEGTFREDFYYRLNVIFVQVPPLRERREDIALLVNHFLREEAKGKTKKKISNQALKVLTNAPWPGNVRQLKHTLEFLCTFHSGKRINAKDLPQNLRQVKKEKESLTLDQAKQEFTQNYLKKILAQTGGQIPKAAKLAGLKRESLYRLMRKHLK